MSRIGKRTRVWIALLGVLTVLLAACSSDAGDADGDGTAAEDAESETEDDAGSEDGDTDAGEDAGEDGGEVSGDPVTLGLVFPQTGATALLGGQVANSAQLAVEDCNMNTGIAGAPLDVEVYDSQGDPEEAAAQAQRAITDGAVAVVGPHSTSEALAAVEVTQREGVVMMGVSAATPSITSENPLSFRVAPLAPDIGAGLVSLAEQLGAERSVLMHDSGGFGLAAAPLIEGGAEEAELEIVSVLEYPINGSDYSAEVSTAISSDPGAVLIAGSVGGDHGLIARAMVEQGLDVPLIGFSPISTEDAVEIQAGAYDQLPGVYTLQTADATKPAYEEYLARYNENFDPIDVMPEQILQTYDAVTFLCEALNETGGEGGEALAQALYDMPAREGVAGREGSTQEFTPEDRDAFTFGEYLTPYIFEEGSLTRVTE